MDSYAKAYGGSKGTRETVRSWGGYAGRHSQSPQQQIKSPRSSTPKSTPTKLELRDEDVLQGKADNCAVLVQLGKGGPIIAGRWMSN